MMKRFLALLLAILMCLSLTACNSNAKYEKYDSIINALEEDDYETAVAEIYKLYQANMGDTDTDTDTDSSDGDTSTDDEVDPAVAKWTEFVPSEYLADSYDEDEPLENFTINADGTCVINGETYNWIIDWASEDNVSIDAMNGMEKVYRISMYFSSRGYTCANLSVYEDEYTYNTVNGMFFRMAELTKIDLTIDNWQDYFALKETIRYNKNSFDEIESMNVERRMVLKEEYGKVISDVSNVAVEYQTMVDNRHKVTADPEAGTYELGEITYTHGPYDPSTTTMSNFYNEDETYDFGLNWSSFYLDEFPEDEVSVVAEKEILRLKGTIYCYQPIEK